MGQSAPSTLAGIRAVKKDFGGETLINLEKEMPVVYLAIDTFFSIAAIVLAGFVISSLAWLKKYLRYSPPLQGGVDFSQLQNPPAIMPLPQIAFQLDNLINMAIAFFSILMGKNTNDLINQLGDLFKVLDADNTLMSVSSDSTQVIGIS